VFKVYSWSTLLWIDRTQNFQHKIVIIIILRIHENSENVIVNETWSVQKNLSSNLESITKKKCSSTSFNWVNKSPVIVATSELMLFTITLCDSSKMELGVIITSSSFCWRVAQFGHRES